jgi:hypothetical protein
VTSSAQVWTLGCSESVWSSGGGKVGTGEVKGDGVLGGSIFSNWRRERGGWGSAWRSQVEEKMKGGHELRRRGRGSSDRQRRATGGGGGQSGDAARTGEMEGGGVWSRGSVREEQ